MKYVPWQNLPKELAAIRQSKQSIVLTTGVFDILNLGHLYYLEDAAKLADCLVVAVDSNKLVQKFKGPKRPYNDQEDRALLLAGLRSVRLVTIFSQMSKLVQVVKPDVFVMSLTTGVTPAQRPETKLVNSFGGRVAVISSRYLIHSSDLVAEILKKNA